MKHFYKNAPKLGNVALSRHAQKRAEDLNLSEQNIQEILWKGDDIEDGIETLWREFKNVRLVILIYPSPFAGAHLIKTIYKIKPNWEVK